MKQRRYDCGQNILAVWDLYRYNIKNLTHLFGQKWVFQIYNYPKHTTKLVTLWKCQCFEATMTKLCYYSYRTFRDKAKHEQGNISSFTRN